MLKVGILNITSYSGMELLRILKNFMKIEKSFFSSVRLSHLLPLYISGVNAGFPSPAEDHTDLSLDLGKNSLAFSSCDVPSVVAIVTSLLFKESQVENLLKFFFKTSGTVPYL